MDPYPDIELYSINVDIVVVGEILQIANLLKDYFNFNVTPPHQAYLIDGTYLPGDRNTIYFCIISNRESGSRMSPVLLHVRGYQSRSAIVIVGDVDNKKAIQEIKDLVKKIIEKLGVLGFKIISIEPTEFKLSSASDPWDRIPDHMTDRTIVKFWHEGLTCPEIALRVYLSSKVVTNIISRLRREYGNDIVPTNEQRRKRLLKN